MIVRILGEAQYDLDEAERPRLDALDDALVKAVDSGDEAAFARALDALATEVRRTGIALADDAFAPSDLVIPFADASLEETRELLGQSESGASPESS